MLIPSLRVSGKNRHAKEHGRILADHKVAFGFLADKEVKNADVGNFGLQDRRMLRAVLSRYETPAGFSNQVITTLLVCVTTYVLAHRFRLFTSPSYLAWMAFRFS